MMRLSSQPVQGSVIDTGQPIASIGIKGGENVGIEEGMELETLVAVFCRS